MNELPGVPACHFSSCSVFPSVSKLKPTIGIGVHAFFAVLQNHFLKTPLRGFILLPLLVAERERITVPLPTGKD
jgi:hypothetical protein